LREIGACDFAESTSHSTIYKESWAGSGLSLADRGSVSSSTVNQSYTHKEVERFNAVESVSTKGQSLNDVLGSVIALITALRTADRASMNLEDVATKGFKLLVCMILFLLWPSDVERKEVTRPPPPAKKVSLLHLAKG
jgi:hypothetical protein